MGKYDDYKEQVLRVSQALSEGGYFGTRSGSAGNVSMLIEGEEAVAVTPSGKRYQDITVEDICVVGFDMRGIEAKWSASVEAPMHIAVYKNRPDVNAVIHTHQPYASIFALLNQPIPALFDEVAVAIGPVVDVVPYAFSGSPELVDNVVSKIGNRCHCYVLRNHGALCIGRNIDKAFHYVELLEKTAATYYHALATGKEVSLLPEEVAMAIFEFTKNAQDMEIERKKQL